MDWNRLFAYDEWANREEAARLRSMASPPEKALKILGHIIGASSVWLARLASSESKLAVWPELTVDQCEAEIDRLSAGWRDVLPKLDLSSDLRYRNTKGEEFTSRIEDVLMHLVIHGGYHRGQIATIVRGAGEAPAPTDYIHATRQGFV